MICPLTFSHLLKTKSQNYFHNSETRHLCSCCNVLTIQFCGVSNNKSRNLHYISPTFIIQTFCLCKYCSLTFGRKTVFCLLDILREIWANKHPFRPLRVRGFSLKPVLNFCFLATGCVGSRANYVHWDACNLQQFEICKSKPDSLWNKKCISMNLFFIERDKTAISVSNPKFIVDYISSTFYNLFNVPICIRTSFSFSLIKVNA
jgi:hypothetical protein